MFKAFATDVDGTITDSNEKIDPDAIIKLREIESIGIPVILVSGHTLCSLETLSEYIGTSGPLVAENGCLVVAKRWEPPIQVGSRDVTIRAYQVLKEELGDRVILKPINKYRVVDLSLKRTFNAEIANKLLKQKNIDAYVMDSGFALHIIDSRVNKGVGLKKAAELIKVDLNEIIGVGDGGNDYHFLKATGYSIALGHAPEKLKRLADYVAKKKYSKGFIEGVEHLFKVIFKK
ncbi:MAG: phosphoglycolate phosphatase [Candidatus Odinarchaeia archaeon]